MPPHEFNNWDKWSRYVLKSIDRSEQSDKEILAKLDSIESKITSRLGSIEQEIATLKVKAGVWALIAGAIPFLIAVLAKLL